MKTITYEEVQEYLKENKDIVDFNIPEDVTEIGQNAFAGNQFLQSVTIPENVSIIGDYAFAGCPSLKKVNIPSNVTSIGKRSFFYCPALHEIDSKSLSYPVSNGILYEENTKDMLFVFSGEYSLPNDIEELNVGNFSDIAKIKIDKNSKLKEIIKAETTKETEVYKTCKEYLDNKEKYKELALKESNRLVADVQKTIKLENLKARELYNSLTYSFRAAFGHTVCIELIYSDYEIWKEVLTDFFIFATNKNTTMEMLKKYAEDKKLNIVIE